MRCRALVVLAVAGWSATAFGQEIARLARSPYKLVRYVNTHNNFALAPPWPALGIHDDDYRSPIPECREGLPGDPDCFRPVHRIVQLGTKPFLAGEEQGWTGMSISSRMEWWIDLSARRFEPVLDFTSGAGFYPGLSGFGREVRGRVAAGARQVGEFYEDPGSRLTSDKILELNFMGFLETARAALESRQ